MIDGHVHLRDFDEWQKETLRHGLFIAHLAGLDMVIEMPNTNPALTSLEMLLRRIDLADKVIAQQKIPIQHAIYAGLTANAKQIEEMVRAYEELFPRVVGFKLFAGQSTGNMGIIDPSEQFLVFETLAKLDYHGRVVVHCEKESLMRKELWNPKKPMTHSIARPPVSETESIRDILLTAKYAGFKGNVHIAHVSLPRSLEIIHEMKKVVDYKITCGVTPHHCLLSQEMIPHEEGGMDEKVNPPLRSGTSMNGMIPLLHAGYIDEIETDHAPHTLFDKREKHMSGMPGFPVYPHFIRYLIGKKRFSKEQIRRLTHDNLTNSLGLSVTNSGKTHCYDLGDEYETNPYRKFMQRAA